MEKNNIERIWNLMAKKLSGEATATELTELEELLRENPQENYSMEIMEDLWKSRTAVNRQYAENKYKELVLELQNRGIDEGKLTQDDHYISGEEATPVKKRNWRPLLLSVLAIGAVVVAFMLYPKDKKQAEDSFVKNEISTKNGSKTTLVLPDGTKVWLNSGSKLTYGKSYGENIREVALTGEAYFDVVKNAQKPFIIHTTKMDIKVLGTAFNVKCYPDERKTETSLVRGSIEVTLKDRQEKIILKPNEKLTISDEEVKPSLAPLPTSSKKADEAIAAAEPIITVSHLTHEPTSNAIIETSWVENRLVFNNETFDEVALKMERWYGVDISIANERLKAKHFTGTFEKETVSQALEAIQLSTPFAYKINKDHIIISP